MFEDIIYNLWRRIFLLLRVLLLLVITTLASFLFELVQAMKGGCTTSHVTREIVCWSIETLPTSFSYHFGLRPMHSLIFPEALSLIEIVGVLIIIIVPSLNKVDLIHA